MQNPPWLRTFDVTQTQLRKALDQNLQRQAQVPSSETHPGAGAQARAEGKEFLPTTVQVEAVRVCKSLGIAIRSSNPEEQRRAGRNPQTLELDLPGRTAKARLRGHGRIPAETFVDGVSNAGGIFDSGFPDLGGVRNACTRFPSASDSIR